MRKTNKYHRQLFRITLLILLFLGGSITNAEHQLNYELIKNWDFSEGNTNFFTDYIYSSSFLKYELYYSVTENPYNLYNLFDSCPDHTTGNGKYFVGNGSMVADLVVWQQQVDSLRHNSIYELSFWGLSVNPLRPAVLEPTINGKALPCTWLYLDTINCIWKQYVCRWNSGDYDSAVIRIIDRNLNKAGNDFGLDDISFQLKCISTLDLENYFVICKGDSVLIRPVLHNALPPVTYQWEPAVGLSSENGEEVWAFPSETTHYRLTVTDSNECVHIRDCPVFVNPKPIADITPNKETTLCDRDTLILSGPDSNYAFRWSNGSTARSIAVTESGTYKLTTKNMYDCAMSDSIEVVFIPLPDSTLATDKLPVICPCDSLKITAADGYDYLWSTGETTQSITVRETGRYKLTLTNWFGCTIDVDTLITVLDVGTDIVIDTLYAKIGDRISFPLYIKSRLNQQLCGFSNYSTTIRFNKSLLIPAENTPFGRIEGNEQVIDLNGSTLDSVLAILSFDVALGDSVCTDITMENFNWECPEVVITRNNGRICLSNVCTTPAPRLISMTDELGINKVAPNPAYDYVEIEFGIIENAPSSLAVFNQLGEKVDEISNFSSAGTYEFRYDTRSLASGAYYIVLKTPTAAISRILNIAR